MCEFKQSQFIGGLQEPEVKLTKFVLKGSQNQESEGKTIVLSENLDLNRNKKWPWVNSNKQSDKQSDLNHSDNSTANQRVLHEAQQFEIIWKNLTFEVNLSAYDRFINKTMESFRPFFSKQSDQEESTANKFSEQNDKQLNNNCNHLFYNQNKRVIFKNLNGYVRSGEISAILGPSGAGKTSLLNAICGKPDNFSGSIELLIDSIQKSSSRLSEVQQTNSKKRMRTSIIPQRDYLIENLTVYENLYYASKILNPNKTFDHNENILRVLKMLNLLNCLHLSTKKLSGGEYKRVSIAQELLKQPDILILDEPTSGLDSLNCKNLIKSLVQLIENSKLGIIKPIAIVMTIHQPDVDIYQMFDHVYCMARFGKVIFDGHPSETIKVIQQQQQQQHEESTTGSASLRLGNHREQSTLATTTTTTETSILNCQNPANLLIEIASEDIYGQELIEKLSSYQLKQFDARLRAIGKELPVSPNADNRPECTMIDLRVPTSSRSKSSENLDSGSISGGKGKEEQVVTSKLMRDKRLQAKYNHQGLFWYHTGLLAKRAFIATIRDQLITFATLTFHLIMPFVMWTVYSPKIGTVTGCPLIVRELDLISLMSNETMLKMGEIQEEAHTTFECATMFFLTTYCFSVCSLTIAAIVFPLNMHILLKEVRNGWYNLRSFVLAKTISSSPFEIIFPMVSIIMIYQLLQMPSSYLEWRMWAIALVMALVSLISHSQGLLFGALCMDSLQSSIFLSTSSSLPLVVLSGFTARIRLMPWLLQKLSWISLYRYSSDLINIIRFGFDNCPCNEQTNQYLSEHKAPKFIDIPDNVRPMFNYYLINSAASASSSGGEQQQAAFQAQFNSSIGSKTLLEQQQQQQQQQQQTDQLDNLVGIGQEIVLNSTERNEILSRMEANELDIFAKMAELVSRSFAFGSKVDQCSAVRAEILTRSGTPADEALPLLFAGLLGILVMVKVLLFITVKFKISSRI